MQQILPGVSNKAVGNKWCKLSGDMASAFKKLIESLEKFMTLKLELQREAIETTKSIAQFMITMEERSRKESREQTLQLAQIFVAHIQSQMSSKCSRKLTKYLHLYFVWIQYSYKVQLLYETWVLFINWCVLYKATKCESIL